MNTLKMHDSSGDELVVNIKRIDYIRMLEKSEANIAVACVHMGANLFGIDQENLDLLLAAMDWMPR
jgi:hypothetical protein